MHPGIFYYLRIFRKSGQLALLYIGHQSVVKWSGSQRIDPDCLLDVLAALPRDLEYKGPVISYVMTSKNAGLIAPDYQYEIIWNNATLA